MWAQIGSGFLKRRLSLSYVELISRASRSVAETLNRVLQQGDGEICISCQGRIAMVFLPVAPAHIIVFSPTAILLDPLSYQSNTYFLICIALTNNPCVAFDACVLF